MNAYINNLSLVFFKKENLRGKTWWMPVFYSLVIQSVVRKSLIRLLDNVSPTPISIKRYLHLAVRLFIASSGGHDPLSRKWDGPGPQASEEEISEAENFERAKLAVRQKDWDSLGIHSSAEYLQHLFEDDGQPFEDQEIGNSNPEVPTDQESSEGKQFSIKSFADPPLLDRSLSSLFLSGNSYNFHNPIQVDSTLAAFKPILHPSTSLQLQVYH
jgi:hypothetical protein